MGDSKSGYVELIPVYSGGMIVLSWVVSVVGAWTTLEILLRRTGNAGAMNVMLLLGAGIAFGSTATFGMHFVGNQAVTLRLPPPWEGSGVPLSYNAGYTILSLIISCLCMILAFSFIGLRLNAPSAKVPDDEVGLGSDHASDDEHAGDKVLDESKYAAPELVDRKRPSTGQTDKSGRFSGMSATAFPLPLPKTRTARKAELKEKQRSEDDLDEDDVDDGGDFGVHAARVSRAGVAKIIGAGVICGGGIAAMHYVGQVSINSVPRITNNWYTIFASILIAMSAVSAGLYILFVVFRPKLQHSWYKRLAVAMLLGAGVTTMHFVALVGTHYYARRGTDLATPSDGATKTVIITIISTVAPLCCILLLVFAYIAQVRHARQRAARHRIILATAIFDHQGLLLVQPESGLPPSARIYPSTAPKEKPSLSSFFGAGNRLRFDASKVKLSRADPAFIAFLQFSWSWRSRRGSDLPTTINEDGTPSARRETAVDDATISFVDGLTDSEAEMMRRSLLSFKMASEDIATQLTGNGQDVRSLGVLYDSILKTGHFEVSSKKHNDKFTVTQGQMLVLTRRLKNATERDNLLARGFVFAEPGAVARLTSTSLACPYDRVFEYFRDAYRFTRFGVVKKLDRGRLYGGLMLLQALPGDGLQVVVDERQHHSLPMTELTSLVSADADRSRVPSTTLPVTTLESVVEGLRGLAGQSLDDLVAPRDASTVYDSAAQLRFLIASTLRPYLDRALSPETLSSLAQRVILEPTIVPLTARSGPPFGADGLLRDSYFVCVTAVVPSSFVIPGRPLNWLPFQLYRAQSDCVAQVPAANGFRPGTATSVATRNSPDDPKAHTSSSTSHDRFDDDLPFPLSTASPFTSTAFPPSTASSTSASFPSSPLGRARTGPSTGGRPSTSQSRGRSEREREQSGETGSPSAASSSRGGGVRPFVDPSTPAGVPPYSPDWVVGLVKDTVSRQGQGQGWRSWDVPARRPAASNKVDPDSIR